MVKIYVMRYIIITECHWSNSYVERIFTYNGTESKLLATKEAEVKNLQEFEVHKNGEVETVSVGEMLEFRKGRDNWKDVTKIYTKIKRLYHRCIPGSKAHLYVFEILNNFTMGDFPTKEQFKYMNDIHKIRK